MSIYEDIYASLKRRWWGRPIIGLAIIGMILFSVWSSLPDSIKERIFLQITNSPKEGAPKEIANKIEMKPTPNTSANSNNSSSHMNSSADNKSDEISSARNSLKLNHAQNSPIDNLRPDGNPYRNQTQEAQYLLTVLGYQITNPDGFEGPATTAALEDFQRKYSLVVSGAADSKTLEILRLRAEKSFLRQSTP